MSHIICYLATNASVILSFDISMLISKQVDYDSTLWREIFVSLVDDQITTVSFTFKNCFLIKLHKNDYVLFEYFSFKKTVSYLVTKADNQKFHWSIYTCTYYLCTKF